jgi:alpha-glucosidase
MERAFPLYHEWGVEGVMLDFMNRDDQEMNQFLEKAVILAAENHLTVTLHGVAKPTGLERTYPNLLNHEAVRNLEYDKFAEDGCTPRHQVIVSYTRMLAGPLDFHEGSFRAVPQEEFVARNVAPVVMGTPTRNLAMYVAYQNHLPMVCDYPSAYRGHPAFPTLVEIPDSWDETHFVSGQVGDSFAVARRSGNIWHLGVMQGEEAGEVLVPLEFLGPGRYQAELWVDDADSQYGMTLREQEVTADRVLNVKCSPGGGAYGRFVPSQRVRKQIP